MEVTCVQSGCLASSGTVACVAYVTAGYADSMSVVTTVNPLYTATKEHAGESVGKTI